MTSSDSDPTVDGDASVATPDRALQAPPSSVGTALPQDRAKQLHKFAELLAHEGVSRGLIGPREVPRLWERHLINSLALLEVLPEESAGQTRTLCDVGSGAGLPGLVVAIARPDLNVTLLEPLLRRTTFLSEAVGTLGLSNVEVLRGRAEEFHGERRFDFVTSRAVAPLDRLLRWCLQLVDAHGEMIALKGSNAQDELDSAVSLVDKLGGSVVGIVEVGASLETTTTQVVRIRWADPQGQVIESPARSTSKGRKDGKRGRPRRSSRTR